jgi:hypothetical protein
MNTTGSFGINSTLRGGQVQTLSATASTHNQNDASNDEEGNADYFFADGDFTDPKNIWFVMMSYGGTLKPRALGDSSEDTTTTVGLDSLKKPFATVAADSAGIHIDKSGPGNGYANINGFYLKRAKQDVSYDDGGHFKHKSTDSGLITYAAMTAGTALGNLLVDAQGQAAATGGAKVEWDGEDHSTLTVISYSDFDSLFTKSNGDKMGGDGRSITSIYVKSDGEGDGSVSGTLGSGDSVSFTGSGSTSDVVEVKYFSKGNSHGFQENYITGGTLIYDGMRRATFNQTKTDGSHLDNATAKWIAHPPLKSGDQTVQIVATGMANPGATPFEQQMDGTYVPPAPIPSYPGPTTPPPDPNEAKIVFSGLLGFVLNDTMTVYSNTGHMGGLERSYTVGGFFLGDLLGPRGLSDAFSPHDAADGHIQSTGERVADGVFGSLSLVTTAIGGAGAIKAGTSCSSAVGRLLGNCFVGGTVVALSELPFSVAASDAIWSCDDSVWRGTWHGTPYSDDANQSQTATLSQPRTTASLLSSRSRILIPIEQVRLGARVPAKNPRPWEYDDSLPEPTTEIWRKISFAINKSDGSRVTVEMLRPTDWISEHRLSVGALIPMNLPELRVTQPAMVMSIDPCPSISHGEGSVVTGKIVTDRVDLTACVRIAGADGQEEEIEGTVVHPFWSVDRQDWVRMGDLQPGEQLLGAAGLAAVKSIALHSRSKSVYNLEVHGEHVYEVGNASILVHNSGPDDCLKAVNALVPKGGGKLIDAALDSTGKVHGILPKLQDLAWYSRDDLEALLPQLRSSVQKRIETTVKLGADYGHNARIADEQALIKSIEKLLGL